MSDASPVTLERDGHAAWLTLNRPEARNALSLPTLNLLRDLLAEIRADDSIWAVVLTGAGDKAFCAGADLKERRVMPEDMVPQFVRQIRATMDDIASLPQPTIAAMNGHAFGGGCEMALACDLRILDEGAMIGLTETSLAIIPGAGGCVRLPYLVGAAKAKELILLARRLGAAEAQSIGLVHEVAPAGRAREQASAMLAALQKNGPLALRAAKDAIDGGLDRTVEQALEYEAACYQRIIPTEDRLEALAAFAEKRAPDFAGR
ncbi:MAG: enoyl-CoA hydratase-related protein [Planctomycetes bacterium]|nr:enoyl-CoA hydratase-related protein [Planctomycetota bacterium]